MNKRVLRGYLQTYLVSVIYQKKMDGEWALPFVEYVAVWTLKLPVPHTDVLKTHSSQSFSTELLESKRTGCKHLSQTHHFKLCHIHTITTTPTSPTPLLKSIRFLRPNASLIKPHEILPAISPSPIPARLMREAPFTASACGR